MSAIVLYTSTIFTLMHDSFRSIFTLAWTWYEKTYGFDRVIYIKSMVKKGKNLVPWQWLSIFAAPQENGMCVRIINNVAKKKSSMIRYL